MAVVQISRIQHRRGQKNTGSGLPQLASGELGWAIDTRELYIGNGSVSEGAPAVGNTKILTEYDNLFSLANTYTFRSNAGSFITGPDSASPIERSLQDRLDDRVSIKSFGAQGDGITDDTEAIQRALDQLYLNAASKGSESSRVTLHIEAGVYLLSDTIYIPPYATLEGAGSYQTVFRQTDTTLPIAKTVNDTSQPGSYAGDETSTFLNQARQITIKGITFEHTGTAKGLILQSCRNSEFIDFSVKGTWNVNSAISFDSIGIEINSLSNAVSSDSNRFTSCAIEQYAYAVRSNWDIKYNVFSECVFDTCYHSLLFGDSITLLGDPGQTTGPNRNIIENSVFKNVNRQAIWVVTGKHNISQNNSFQSVGNDGGPETSPQTPVIQFDDETNLSNRDWFSRTEALISGGGVSGVPYIPEVGGSAHFELDYVKPITFGDLSNTRLFRLPVDSSQTYELAYSISNPDFTKRGTLTIVVNTANDSAEISDDFHFVGDEFYLDKQSFDTALRTLGAGASSPNTLDVKVTADLNNGSQSEIKFTISSKRN